MSGFIQEKFKSRKAVAFLQNQWFKDPETMQRIHDDLEKRYAPYGREAFLEQFLFYRCLTGKRLRAAFGEDGIYEIVWEECSKNMGGEASSKFPADLEHMLAVLCKFEPLIVFAFGKLAQDAVCQLQIRKLWNTKSTLIMAPHPAARGDDVVPRLANAALCFTKIKQERGI